MNWLKRLRERRRERKELLAQLREERAMNIIKFDLFQRVCKQEEERERERQREARAADLRWFKERGIDIDFDE
jgi:hypothetical protein